jgi:3-isopropylmalate/(R)-2-methylmalate dehydratase large subunit
MEFTGEAIDSLSMSGRFTMTNMAVEAGAKTGIMEADQKTLDFVKGVTKRPFEIIHGDNDEYARIIEYDVSAIEPQVALPSSPANSKGISQLGNITLDQVVIGSCTNGRLEDLQMAAEILKGRKVHHGVRCIIIPGSQKTYLEALKEGLMEVFVRAGAAVGPSVCGPCPGGHMGILAAGERCLSTTNRNFIGRMGSPQSEIYLANPAVAAASAVTGKITHPDEILKR